MRPGGAPPAFEESMKVFLFAHPSHCLATGSGMKVYLFIYIFISFILFYFILCFFVCSSFSLFGHWLWDEGFYYSCDSYYFFLSLVFFFFFNYQKN